MLKKVTMRGCILTEYTMLLVAMCLQWQHTKICCNTQTSNVVLVHAERQLSADMSLPNNRMLSTGTLQTCAA